MVDLDYYLHIHHTPCISYGLYNKCEKPIKKKIKYCYVCSVYVKKEVSHIHIRSNLHIKKSILIQNKLFV